MGELHKVRVSCATSYCATAVTAATEAVGVVREVQVYVVLRMIDDVGDGDDHPLGTLVAEKCSAGVLIVRLAAGFVPILAD